MAKPRIPSPIHIWTALKLEYLDYYLQAYVIATKQAQQTHYIDAFAGCGECVLRENGYPVQGSPWRALNTIPPFTHYHFVEKEPPLASHLRKCIWEKGVINADVYTGDCNVVLPTEVLPKVPKNVPSFAFIDPRGLQLHWATVEALASHRRGRKMELLILYPYDMAVVRQLSLAVRNQAYYDRLSRFYGDESWLEQFQQSVSMRETTEQRRERFIQLYVHNLRSLGYKYVIPFAPLRSQNRPLYHMIFAGNHPAGSNIIGSVWAKPRFVPGQLGYEPVRRQKT